MFGLGKNKHSPSDKIIETVEFPSQLNVLIYLNRSFKSYNSVTCSGELKKIKKTIILLFTRKDPLY